MAEHEARFIGGMWYPPDLGRWRMTGPLAVLVTASRVSLCRLGSDSRGS
jgi:hypothetical protein